MAAGVNVAFGHDCVMLLVRRVLRLHPGIGTHGLHVAQMTSQKGIRQCFDAVTVNAAKVMHLESYGIAPGCDASFVLLQARDAVEAIRLKANRLKVWKKGTLLAETPEVVARLQLPQRSSTTRFMPSLEKN